MRGTFESNWERRIELIVSDSLLMNKRHFIQISVTDTVILVENEMYGDPMHNVRCL